MTDFEAFLDQVRARLEVGRIEYGDVSLDRPASELIAEIQAELADVCGWSAILWARLQRLRAAAERVEGDHQRTPEAEQRLETTGETGDHREEAERARVVAVMGGRRE